jgi:hypothetical protein
MNPENADSDVDSDEESSRPETTAPATGINIKNQQQQK